MLQLPHTLYLFVIGCLFSLSNSSFAAAPYSLEGGETLNPDYEYQAIEFVSSGAYLNGHQVNLNWATAMEFNNAEFIIERSSNGIDWEEISQKQGAGTSNSIIEYFEVDYSPLDGISYYRVKQIDYYNGNCSYTNTFPVYNPIDANGEISLFPSAALIGGDVRISLPDFEGEEMLVVLRDKSGNESFSKVKVYHNESTLTAVSLEEPIAEGNYLVVASSNDLIYSQRLVIRK